MCSTDSSWHHALTQALSMHQLCTSLFHVFCCTICIESVFFFFSVLWQIATMNFKGALHTATYCIRVKNQKTKKKLDPLRPEANRTVPYHAVEKHHKIYSYVFLILYNCFLCILPLPHLLLYLIHLWCSTEFLPSLLF